MDEISRQRQLLPIYSHKKEIIEALKKEDCAILVAETACGKSTQIPQYLYEAGLSKKKIIGITQPRRVAAITIAQRVAQEVGTPLGEKVGYTIRFQDVTSPATRIKYVTDGCLLRESIGDPLLLNYSIIVLDEAHERTIHTDILFGIVKSAQSQRKEKSMMPLKVFIMSATMDHAHFSQYFNKATAYFIPGRQYSINIYYIRKKVKDYAHSSLVAVFKLHRSEDEGDMLVFCTGQEEIEFLVEETRRISQYLEPGYRVIVPYPLYSALPSEMQLQVFKPLPEGQRKVIFATNIAETSLTIPGIKYVIDTGNVKARTFNPTVGLDMLKVQRISKQQAIQRTGRAGREGDGNCYRLYTEAEYDDFRQSTIPEIQRTNLGSVILQIIALGIKNVREFDFLDKPSDENIDAAIELLKLLKAVEEVEDGLELTECGQLMVQFPLDPRYSKMIITSKQLRCTDEILSIIALLSVESLFYTPPPKKEEAVELKKKFSNNQGDHIMLLNMYKMYIKAKGNRSEWCKKNFVNCRNMKKVQDVRKQLSDVARKCNILPCSCQDAVKIKKCIASGLFMNAAELQSDRSYETIANRKKVHIHPSSTMFSLKYSYVLYTELVETTKCYMRTNLGITAFMLQQVAPEYFTNSRYIGTKIINHL